MHVVVIGAVALGPKAAARFKRLRPDGRVTMLDQGEYISYGGCGIPYFISGEVSRLEDLRSTTYGTVRDAAFFKSHKGIDVLTRCRATAIDRAAKTVNALDLRSGRPFTLQYDRLVLATGGTPKRPPVPGIDLRGVTACATLEEAERIKNAAARGQVSRAVVVGGGFAGLETTVAFADMWGIETCVVEADARLLPGVLSDGLAAMVAADLAANKVGVHVAERLVRLEGENGKVTRAVTNKREIPAELVVLATGVRPNTELAGAAGLARTESGLIVVDDHLRTSDRHIYSGGDCAAVRNLVTGGSGWFPLGSLANRQGRVIGGNLAGREAVFPGGVGTWAVKLFGLSAAGAGLTLEGALREGRDAVKIHVEQLDRAHFYPERALVSLDLVVDGTTRQVLGIQGVAPNGDGLLARINPVAALLSRKITVEEVGNLEVACSPPFASATDVVNTLGNVAENVLDGRLDSISIEEFKRKWEEQAPGSLYVLDARVAAQGGPVAAKYPGLWHSAPADQITALLDQIPRDREVLLICNTGLRSFEAQLILKAHGFKNTRSLMGGVAAQGRMGVEI